MRASLDHKPFTYTTQAEPFPGSFLGRGHRLRLHMRPRAHLGNRLVLSSGLVKCSRGTCLHESDELLLHVGLQVWVPRRSKLVHAGVV